MKTQPFHFQLPASAQGPVLSAGPARWLGLLLAGLCLSAHWLQARINVVTLPGRDAVQLTIYNSADLTLVRETRSLVFRKGLNRLEFSWANTLIDPTSVEFKPLTHADEVEVLDVRFPPRVTNTLEWNIQSGRAGEMAVEISYFTSGITWSADYAAEASRSEKLLALAGSVRIKNNSGEDYENAQVRLVVGVIRLVEEIAALAQAGQADADRKKGAVSSRSNAEPQRRRLAESVDKSQSLLRSLDRLERREIVKEGLSEYFLYTVEGRDTIPTGWAKRLPSFEARGIPLASYCKFEKERWGEQVIRYYRFKNDTASKLGKEPLPDGQVAVFRTVADDQSYALVGRTAVKYIPVNAEVELELGPDPEMRVQPVLANWEKTDLRFDNEGNVKGWTIRETWRVEIRNSREIEVLLDIRRNLPGDRSLKTEGTYETVDAHKVKFLRPLKPREKQEFIYEVTTRWGTNATR
jgi:hypothetical protein